MTDRELFEQALEVLEWHLEKGAWGADIEGVTAILRERLAQPEPPPECTSEAEKTAFAFGWLKAMEAQRLAQPEQDQKPPVKSYCGGKPNFCTPEQEPVTREDIIRMAQEAAFYDGEIGRAEDSFVHFANLVAAAEREACAKLCEADGLLWGRRYAAAIRARGQA